MPCFNSRTLGRVRHKRYRDGVESPIVSIHAPWEGCDDFDPMQIDWNPCVSIHAPWEGCDDPVGVAEFERSLVSIHAPWEGCDLHRL